MGTVGNRSTSLEFPILSHRPQIDTHLPIVPALPTVDRALTSVIVFNENGVQIMTSAYEGDPDTPKVVAKENVFAVPPEKERKAS